MVLSIRFKWLTTGYITPAPGDPFLASCTYTHNLKTRAKQSYPWHQAEQKGKTDLHGLPEACLLVLDTAHEQETEGLLCDCMPLVDDFLGERRKQSPSEPTARPRQCLT